MNVVCKCRGCITTTVVTSRACTIGVRGYKIWGGGRYSARRARNARELLGGSGGMFPRKILKSRVS